MFAVASAVVVVGVFVVAWPVDVDLVVATKTSDLLGHEAPSSLHSFVPDVAQSDAFESALEIQRLQGMQYSIHVPNSYTAPHTNSYAQQMCLVHEFATGVHEFACCGAHV